MVVRSTVERAGVAPSSRTRDSCRWRFRRYRGANETGNARGAKINDLVSLQIGER